MVKPDKLKGGIISPSSKKDMIYFLLKYFSFTGLFLFLELWNPINQKVIIPFTALITRVSVFLLNIIGTPVKASGTFILSPHFSADIKAGCNGIEPIIILLAAVLAFPAPWKGKCKGFLWGSIILQGVNLIRIVSLVYLGIHHPQFFKEAHSIIWQIVMIALSIFLWIIWAKGLTKNETKVS